MNSKNSVQNVLDAAARLDFYTFAIVMWKVLYGSKPFHELPYLYCLCWHLQEFAEGRCKRLLVCIAPRMLKSYLASIALPAWMLGHNPALRIGTFSYGEQVIEEFSKQCQIIMKSAEYQRIFPGTVLGDKQAAHHVNTTANGYRRAISTGGQSTGFGFDRGIVDDSIKPTDVVHANAREANYTWFQSSVLTRLDNKVTDCLLVVMQRLHPDDLPGQLIASGEWTVLAFPIQAEQRIEYPYGDKTFVMNKGDLLDPIRHPESVVASYRRSLGPVMFSAQYQQNPLQGIGGIFHWNQFRAYDVPPKDFSLIVQSWDVACSLSPTADYSVCTTWGNHGKDAYLLDVCRCRREMPDLLRTAIQLDDKWRPNLIIAETVSIGRVFAQELWTRGYKHLIPYDPKDDKVTRAHEVTTLIDDGRIWVPEAAPWLVDFKNEIKAFDMGRYDDQVDSMTQFLKHLNWLIERPNPRARPHGKSGPWQPVGSRVYVAGTRRLFQYS